MTIRLKKYLRGNVRQRVKKSIFVTLDSDFKWLAFAVFSMLTPHRQLLAQKLLRNFQALPTRRPSVGVQLQ